MANSRSLNALIGSGPYRLWYATAAGLASALTGLLTNDALGATGAIGTALGGIFDDTSNPAGAGGWAATFDGATAFYTGSQFFGTDVDKTNFGYSSNKAWTVAFRVKAVDSALAGPILQVKNGNAQLTIGVNAYNSGWTGLSHQTNAITATIGNDATHSCGVQAYTGNINSYQLDDGSFHTVHITFKNVAGTITWNIYFDGAPLTNSKATGNSGANISAAANLFALCTIGKSNDPGPTTNYLKGSLQWLGVWQREMSPWEVRQQFLDDVGDFDRAVHFPEGVQRSLTAMSTQRVPIVHGITDSNTASRNNQTPPLQSGNMWGSLSAFKKYFPAYGLRIFAANADTANGGPFCDQCNPCWGPGAATFNSQGSVNGATIADLRAFPAIVKNLTFMSCSAPSLVATNMNAAYIPYNGVAGAANEDFDYLCRAQAPGGTTNTHLQAGPTYATLKPYDDANYRVSEDFPFPNAMEDALTLHYSYFGSTLNQGQHLFLAFTTRTPNGVGDTVIAQKKLAVQGAAPAGAAVNGTDWYARDTMAIPAGTSRVAGNNYALWCTDITNTMGGPQYGVKGPCGFAYAQFCRDSVNAGVSVNFMAGYGGATIWDFLDQCYTSEFCCNSGGSWAPLIGQIAEYFTMLMQPLIAKGQQPTLMFLIESGFNDLNLTNQAYTYAGFKNSAFTSATYGGIYDNLNTFIQIVEAAWQQAGYALANLDFWCLYQAAASLPLTAGYGWNFDFLSRQNTYQAFRTLARDRKAAGKKPMCVTIGSVALPQEALITRTFNGVTENDLVSPDYAHLYRDGYRETWNAMLTSTMQAVGLLGSGTGTITQRRPRGRISLMA